MIQSFSTTAISAYDGSNTVTLTFPSGTVRRVPYPASLARLAADDPEMKGAVAAQVNGLLMSLVDHVPAHNAEVVPILPDTPGGHSVLKRSLVFLMMMAAEKEVDCRELALTVEHAAGPEGTGYVVVANNGERQITPQEIEAIKARMQELAAADLPVNVVKLGYTEATQYFAEHNKQYTLRLVATANEFTVRCSACKDHLAVYRRPLVPRTGMLAGKFDLQPFDVGFVLAFPPAAGGPVPRVEPDPVIFQVYKDWNKWGKVLQASCVGSVNERVVNGKAKEFMALCEAVHGERMVLLSMAIQKKVAKGCKLILIAGPSSSGKTTFACKLSIQLEILGIRPMVLSVDNYYKQHSEVPRDAKGNMDFEALEALRVDLLNDHLLRLMNGEEVATPIFDFHTGKPREETLAKKLPRGGVVIMEGIHCLNDKLTPRVPADSKFKIFLAPLTQVNLDESSFLSNSVTRLLRRIIRDYRTRGYSALDTMGRWESVRRGEDVNIFPFARNADVVFNSSLDFEVNVLKTFCKPLLKTVKPGTPHYNMAQELLSFLSNFFAIPHDSVPPQSLLREFIGGGCFGVD